MTGEHVCPHCPCPCPCPPGVTGVTGVTGPALPIKLTLDYLFRQSAGQTYTFKILGEKTGIITADETIILNVPQAKMNTILAYSSNWVLPPGSQSSGNQPVPDIALILRTITGTQLDQLTMGLTGATSGTPYPFNTEVDLVIGDQSSSCNALTTKFQDVDDFKYSSVAGSSGGYLNLIPREAIRSYSSSIVATAPLSGIVNDISVIPTPNQTEAYAGLSGAVQSLFEQAINAGMVTVNNTRDIRNTQLVSGRTIGNIMDTNVPVYGAQFAVGQSLAIYVEFELTKRREYKLESFPNMAGTAPNQAIEITFGGAKFRIPVVSEASQVMPVKYEIVFNTIP
jgi:hypothetical protein